MDKTYTLRLNKTGYYQFTMPNGFESTVQVYTWGAGGGAGSGAVGGGGGFAFGNIQIFSGNTVSIVVGTKGGDASGPGAGSAGTGASIGYNGGSGANQGDPEDGDAGGSGGGGGATAVLINGTATVVAAGGGGGGGYGDDGGRHTVTPGLPGGVYVGLTGTTNGQNGLRGGGGGGGAGGGGFLGGQSGTAYGDDDGGGRGGSGGQNYGILTLAGTGTVGAGLFYKTTYEVPSSTGNAGYDGYAILIFTHKLQLYNKVDNGNILIGFSGNITANVTTDYISQAVSNAIFIPNQIVNGNTLIGTYFNANVFTIGSGNVTVSNISNIAVPANVYPVLSTNQGNWETVDKVYFKTTVAGLLSNVATKTFSALAGPTEYTVPGTYTYPVPDDVTLIEVRLVGAGGGGSSYNDGCNYGASNSGGGGGGSGGYNQTTIPVTPLDVITVTVAAGGGGGGDASVCYYGTNGGNGGNTSIQSGIIGTLVATGGTGATVGWEFNGGPAYGGNQAQFAPGVRNGGYGGLPGGNNGDFGGNQGNPTNGLGGASPLDGFGKGGDGGRPTNGGAGGYVSIRALTGTPFNTFPVPPGVTQIFVNYQTPTGLATKSMPTTPGETLIINLGDFGQPSTVIGLSGTLSLPAYDVQVFSYSGNVDHIIAQDVQVATATPTSYSANGSNSTLTAGAAAAGITYNVTYEGWHDDLGATISITPVLISTLVQPLKVYVKSGSGRQFPSAHTYQKQPSASNGYIMNDFQGDYYGGEGAYSWATNLQQQGWVSFTYSQPYAPGTWIEVEKIFVKDGNWKPLITDSAINLTKIS